MVWGLAAVQIVIASLGMQLPHWLCRPEIRLEEVGPGQAHVWGRDGGDRHVSGEGMEGWRGQVCIWGRDGEMERTGMYLGKGWRDGEDRYVSGEGMEGWRDGGDRYVSGEGMERWIDGGMKG